MTVQLLLYSVYIYRLAGINAASILLESFITSVFLLLLLLHCFLLCVFDYSLATVVCFFKKKDHEIIIIIIEEEEGMIIKIGLHDLHFSSTIIIIIIRRVFERAEVIIIRAS